MEPIIFCIAICLMMDKCTLYFIATLIFAFLICIFRIVNDEDKRDYDIGVLTIVKIANISLILYTPKIVWIISGLIIFSLFLMFCYRHSRIGFAELLKNKTFFVLYMSLYLLIFFRSVHQCGWLLGIYGVQLSFVFAYLLHCALRTNMFYRGILYGSISIITLILIGRYSCDKLSMFYLYVEAVFIGLCYVCYLNWYNYYIYLNYLPFVRKRKANLFFDKNILLNIIGFVALTVVLLDLPLTKLTIINSGLIALVIWSLYSAIIGFFNLGKTGKDISDYDNDEEILRYYQSLPENIKLKIQKEMEEIRERKQRCRACREIYDKLESMPRFMKSIK